MVLFVKASTHSVSVKYFSKNIQLYKGILFKRYQNLDKMTTLQHSYDSSYFYKNIDCDIILLVSTQYRRNLCIHDVYFPFDIMFRGLTYLISQRHFPNINFIFLFNLNTNVLKLKQSLM